MKRGRKKHFTLVELMFTVGILVLLIGISWVVANHVIREQIVKKTQGDIQSIMLGVEGYKATFGTFPGVIDADMSTTPEGHTFNFGELLSKVKPNTSGWTKKRPMFVDFKKYSISVSNSDYNAHNAGTTIVNDPYENAYRYRTDGERFVIWSVGVDGINDQGNGDDISSEFN